MAKTKSSLFEEAISDAKAIKEVALANAKKTLEESFTPALRERFAAKLEEMDAEDDITDVEDLTLENEVETTDEELNLEALLAELDGETGKEAMEETEIVAESEEIDEAEDDDDEKKDDAPKKETKPKSDEDKPKAKKDDAKPKADPKPKAKKEDDEEVSIEDMSEEDLKTYIEDVVKDMVATGELENAEAGMDGTGVPVGEPEMDLSMDDEDVNLDELTMEDENVSEYGNEHEISVDDALEMKEQLAEAHKVIRKIKKDLQEVNLFNAKLLYSNKIFKAKNNLTESQKIKILNSFDKTTSIKEAKLVYNTLMEGLKTVTTKSNLRESVIKGMASKTISSIGTKKPIMEVNDQFARWQKLAGIK